MGLQMGGESPSVSPRCQRARRSKLENAAGMKFERPLAENTLEKWCLFKKHVLYRQALVACVCTGLIYYISYIFIDYF